MHPDDHSPYRSREDLFETIRQQRIQIDNLHERIRKLESKQVESRNELCTFRNGRWITESDLDTYAQGLPV